MNPQKEKWLLLIVLSIIWGSSFILIKKGLEHFSPYEVGGLRVLFAGIILFPFALKQLKKFPRKNLKWLLLAAFTGNFIPMFLFPIAETKTSSIIAGIVNSMMPIFVIIVGALLWNFATTKKQITGVTISFAGACILALGSGESGELKLFPVLLLLLATLCYAISTTTVKKKLSDIPATVLSSFVFGFVLILPSLLTILYTGFFSTFSFTEENLKGLGFVLLLSVFGTGLAMILNYRLLKISSPLFASTVTLLMPVFALFWGVLYGEHLTLQQLFGGAVIIAGLIFLRTENKKTAKP